MILGQGKKKHFEEPITRDLDSTTAMHLTTGVLQGFTCKFVFFIQSYEGKIVGNNWTISKST